MVNPIQSTNDAFNPAVKNTEPGNYTGLFRSIDSYEQPSPLGVALKGFANLLDKGVDAAMALVKNDMVNSSEKELEPMRDEYTTALRNASDYVDAKTKPAASPEYTTNLIPGPEGGSPAGTPVQAVDLQPNDPSLLAKPDVQPPEMKEFSRQLDVINAGRQANGGKFSETEFWGRVRDKVKDMRNRYPIEMRPEFDAIVAAKFGTTPANAYIQGMIRDINAAMTSGKEQKNATLSWIRTHSDVPGMDKVFTSYNNGDIDTNTAVQRASSLLQPKYIIAQNKSILELEGEQMKTDTQRAERNAQTIAAATTAKFMASETTAIGLDGKRLDQLQLDYMNGKFTPTAVQAEALARNAEGTRIKVRDAVLKDLQEIKNGKSYQSLTSAKYVMDLADQASKPFADIRDSFAKGDLSAATLATRIVDAAKADFTSKGIFEYPDAMKTLFLTDMFKRYGMPEQLILDNIRPLMLQGKPEQIKLNHMINQSKLEIATPSEVLGSMPTGMNITSTFKGQLERMEAILKANGIDGKTLPNHLNEFTKIIDGKQGVSLVNTDDPQIIETIAHNVFGPGNKNAFQYFNQNEYDSQGRLIPGSQYLFNRFSHPDVVKQIMKTSTPVQKEYSDFMQITAREDLLRNDLPKLKEGINTPGAPWTIAWDTQTKNFKVIPGVSHQEPSNATLTGRKGLQQTVTNVNMVLDGLKSIATTSGKKDEEIDAFVLSPVINTLGDISNVPGLTLGLATTIRNAYLEQAKEKAAAEDKAKSAKEKYTKPPKGE